LKNITNYFLQKDVLFKQIEEIKPKELASRKKVEIYYALGIDKNYYAIFIINTNSRFIRKNAEDLMLLTQKLIDLKEHNFKKKILLISSPLCSKAKALLKENGWSVKNDFMWYCK